MRLINHALTGAAIGLAMSSPVVALPAALVSHFVCDALPHFGSKQENDTALRSKFFAPLLGLDIVLCILLALFFAAAQPQHWWLAIACAFIATTPDLSWLPGYIRTLRGGRYSQRPNRFMRFAAGIQWFEKPIGAAVEIAWFVVFTGAILTYLY